MRNRLKQAWALFIFLFPAIIQAQNTQDFSGLFTSDSVKIIPGKEYAHHWPFVLLFGKHYRNTWAAPITVPILDIHKAGLKVIKIGGRLETFSITLSDNNGKIFVARSVNKDLSKALPPFFRKTFVGALLRDQVSANEPYSALAVAPLAKAAGIIYSPVQLCVLRGDSIFHKYDDRQLLVILEERLDLGLLKDKEKPREEDGTETMMRKRFSENKYAIDPRSYLQARLLDMLIGDWSRHEDQYKWLYVKEDKIRTYRPVPRDRDHAFYKNDGFFNKLALMKFSQARSYRRDLKHVSSLNFMGRNLDKLILPQLTWKEWNEITESFSATITDNVIDFAAAKLPAPAFRDHGEFIRDALKTRRGQLLKGSRRFYDLINEKILLFGSDEADVFEISGDAKGNVNIEVRSGKSEEKNILYSRSFDPGETKKITIYALAGNDKLILKGHELNKGPNVFFNAGPGNLSINEASPGKKLKISRVKSQELLKYYMKGSNEMSKKQR